jgi:hypothetical protein
MHRDMHMSTFVYSEMPRTGAASLDHALQFLSSLQQRSGNICIAPFWQSGNYAKLNANPR